MANAHRWRVNEKGRYVRNIVILQTVWEWLKAQPGGASKWIEYTAGRAMMERVNERLREENQHLRGELDRLRDILNAQGVDTDRRRRGRRP